MSIILTDTSVGGSFELPQAHLDVLAERQRQVRQEGWVPKHDDEHIRSELAIAAACYALPADERDRIMETGGEMVYELWPWERKWWKPTDRRRDLVKAGALILAEIERLDRAAERSDG